MDTCINTDIELPKIALEKIDIAEPTLAVARTDKPDPKDA
jgi:hypothetical protein